MIWGAGSYGHKVLKIFQKYGFEKYVVAFCDNSKSKWNTYIEEFKVLNYKQIKDNYKNEIIFLICIEWEKEIKEQLTGLKEQYISINIIFN